MGAIQRLCNRCIWLHDGNLRDNGFTSQIVNGYINDGLSNISEKHWPTHLAPGDEKFKLLSVRICQPKGISCDAINITQPFEIEVEVEIFKPISEVVIALKILTGDGQVVIHTANLFGGQNSFNMPGKFVNTCMMPAYALNVGTFTLSIGSDIPNKNILFFEESVIKWSVESLCPIMGRYQVGAWSGLLGPGLAKWGTHSISK